MNSDVIVETRNRGNASFSIGIAVAAAGGYLCYGEANTANTLRIIRF